MPVCLFLAHQSFIISMHILLSEACAEGALDPDDWCDCLLAMVSDPRVKNRDLLIATERASRGLERADSQLWMDNLLEFSLWHTGSLPERLDLCDYLYREGNARLDSSKRWSSHGGLLHVACEGASYSGISWALERDPGAVFRRGGRLGLTAIHALCARDTLVGSLEGLELLMRHGADPNAISCDGRTALFRCSMTPLALRLMALGADPWLLDTDGFGVVGLWLELGLAECAETAFRSRRSELGSAHPWGSLSLSKGSTPRRDPALFIPACSAHLRGERAIAERDECMRALVALGADPLGLDGSGRTLFERAPSAFTLSLMERAQLNSADIESTSFQDLADSEGSRRL